MGCTVSSQEETNPTGAPPPANSTSVDLETSATPAMAEGDVSTRNLGNHDVPPIKPHPSRSAPHVNGIGSATRQRLGKKGYAFTSILLPEEAQAIEEQTMLQEGSESMPEAAATVAGNSSHRKRESRESSQNSYHEHSPSFSPRDPKSGPSSPMREGARVRKIQFVQDSDGLDCSDMESSTVSRIIPSTTVNASSIGDGHFTQSESTHELPVA